MENAEMSFVNYLHGKNDQGSTVAGSETSENNFGSSWKKISEGVGNQLWRMGLMAVGGGWKKFVLLKPMLRSRDFNY
jgi:hypothetical protein